MPQLVGNEIAAAFEQPDRAADARLGITHVLADVYRAHILILLGQKIYIVSRYISPDSCKFI